MNFVASPQSFLQISRIAKSQGQTSLNKTSSRYKAVPQSSRISNAGSSQKIKLKRSISCTNSGDRAGRATKKESTLQINFNIQYYLSKVPDKSKKTNRVRSLLVLRPQFEEFQPKKQKIKSPLQDIIKNKRKQTKKIAILRKVQSLSRLHSLRKKGQQYREQANLEINPFMTSLSPQHEIRSRIKLSIPKSSKMSAAGASESMFFEFDPKHKQIVKKCLRESLQISERQLKLINMQQKYRYDQKLKKVRRCVN